MRTLLLASALLSQLALGQTILDATNKSMEVVTTSTSAIDYTVSYVDYTASGATPGSLEGAITTATTTTYVPAPAAATQRQLKRVGFRNKGTATNTITIQKDVGGTNYEMYSTALGPDDVLTVDSEGERHVYGSDGLEKIAGVEAIDGRTISYLKVGATSEAVGLFQLMNKDTGFPGAWVPGTPGLNGTADACSSTAGATIAGAPYLPDPATGNYFLTSATAASSTVGMLFALDLVWHNTGLVVTTTTAQAITQPALGARDSGGSTNGENWQAGILVTTATTNAGAVTNMTMSYTDQDGNAGNTATISSFPATAVAGALIQFQLAAGDRGVRSIQSVTLGTSLVTGAVSAVMYRPIIYVSAPVANVGGTVSVVNANPAGVKLWNGTCLVVGYLASATTATTLNLNVAMTVR